MTFCLKVSGTAVSTTAKSTRLLYQPLKRGGRIRGTPYVLYMHTTPRRSVFPSSHPSSIIFPCLDGVQQPTYSRLSASPLDIGLPPIAT